MTTYLGDKAVGIGTVKATMSVGKVITDNRTILGDGFTEPLSVDTEIIATKVQVGNLATTLHAEIDAQADAIAKTRNDMNEKDSELESILNEHAGELTTLRGNQASLGDQVSNIESKIPESASETNPLITKQQLLDEEMDIRDDYNELVSELQTQITAQAGAIAGKQDELVAGTGIKIDGNVISATGGGGSVSANVIHDSTLTGAGTNASPLGLSTAIKDEIADKAPKETVEALTTAVNDIYTGLSGKQDKLTAGENITIEDGVISATGGGGELPDNVLVNKPNGKKSSLVITPDYNGNYGAYNIAIGAGVVDSRNYSVHIGYDSLDSTTTGCSVGIGSKTRTAAFSVAIGYDAEAIAQYSIQIGSGENKDANTLKVSNANGNFEMMSADGTIPLERLTKVTDQIGDISTALTAILGE